MPATGSMAPNEKAGSQVADAARQPGRIGLATGFPRRDLIMSLARALAKDPPIDRIWLFGSRARGDAFERSDIDLAIEAPALPEEAWTRLHLDFPEQAPTLLLVDLVRLDAASRDLREQIEAEGIMLYERPGARPA